MDVKVTVNGETYERDVEPRKLLIHLLRDDLDLTGSHVGCDTGNCGACSVILDGVLVKSCMLLAVQANGASIETPVRSMSIGWVFFGIRVNACITSFGNDRSLAMARAKLPS